MRVLVLGAGGFIGARVAGRLRRAGHEVIAGVRGGRAPELDCDLARDLEPSDWKARLEGIDAVVNAVGILRPRLGNDFEAVHVRGPRALWAACAAAGVKRVIQLSALGNPRRTEFIASKHRGDEALMAMELDWTVLRPSVVYSPTGSYGGTTLLRGLALSPLLIPIPAGAGRIQPVCLEDLCELVLRCLEQGLARRQPVEVVGPEAMSLEHYLRLHRRWLGAGAAPALGVPRFLVAAASWLGEWFTRGPLGRTMFHMLRDDNVGDAASASRVQRLLGCPPRTLAQALAWHPSGTADRWQARLVLIGPLLILGLALLWLGSGLVGLTTPPALAEQWVQRLGLPGGVGLVQAASVLDLALGLAFLNSRWRGIAGLLMLASLLVYTVVLGLRAPELWLEPFGSLLKNLPLIPAVAVAMVLGRER